MAATARYGAYGFRPAIRAYVAIPTVAVGAFLALPGAFAGEKSIGTWVWIAAVTAAVGAVLLLLFRSATVIRPEAIVFRGVVRTRRVSWSEVQAVTIESNIASLINRRVPTRRMVIYDRLDRRLESAHFTNKNADSLEIEVEAVQVAWERGRGSDWAPVPDVQARIAAQWRRRFS
jgi:hypothetical protein